VTLLAALRSHLAAVDQRVAELVLSHPDGVLITSLPVSAPALVPRLMVAFGTRRDRYQNAYQMQCYSAGAGVGVEFSAGRRENRAKRHGQVCASRRWRADQNQQIVKGSERLVWMLTSENTERQNGDPGLIPSFPRVISSASLALSNTCNIN